MVKADCERGVWDGIALRRHRDGFHETGWPGILIREGRV
jgi:hypothetical protein